MNLSKLRYIATLFMLLVFIGVQANEKLIPRASFSVKETTQCQNVAVDFIDNSSVSVGKISR